MTRSPLLARRLIPLLAALAVLLPAASASAGTVTREGDALVFRAAPGEANVLFVNDEDTELVFSDASAYPITVNAPGCAHSEFDPPSTVRCAPAARIRAELGDGDDALSLGYGWPATIPVSADGGPGNDRLTGGAGADALSGGDGDDTLKGDAGDDALDGGPGRDDLDGGTGGDVVRGGDGDDLLAGDPGASMAADVLDGGPGRDTLSEYEYNDGPTSQRAVRVTLDAGGADDGRPGEGDQLTGLEVVHLLVAAEMVAGPTGADLKVFRTTATPSRLIGGPGNDTLTGFDYDDTIDGGPGDDLLIGAYGHDTITGGPGKDTINADAVDGCNFLECRPIYGNDVVYVRDGEVDTVACGPGTDRVVADAADVVAPDCETVERPATTTPGGPGGPKPPDTSATAKKLKVSVPKALTARALKSGSGRALKVTAPGAGRIAVTLARGKKGTGGTAATGSAKAKASGTVTVRIKARTTAQRRRLRTGTYRLTVRWTPAKGGARQASVTVKLR